MAAWRRVRPATNFAFGVIKADEFHLTPVHATMQMRPCFQHIDEAKVRFFFCHLQYRRLVKIARL